VRTTLTLDDDVAIQLRRLQEKQRAPLKRIVNTVLRAGLAAVASKPAREQRPFRTESASLGTPRLKSLDNISEVLAFAEGEDYR
jgi:hypothetical protein